MNRRAFLFASLAAAPAVMSGGPASQRKAGRLVSLTREEMEKFLRTAQIVRLRNLSSGITNSQRATLDDGSLIHDAHAQTIDEFKITYETATTTYINFRDTYKHNIAAYRLDKMLELRMTPVSVERKVRGRTAALTWWVDDILMDGKERYLKNIEAPEPERWNRQIYCVRVFDELIYNIDRNLGNLLITRDWTVWMIDHTRAFRPDRRLKNPDNLVRCDRLLLPALEGLTMRELKEEMGSYLTKMQYEGLLSRRDLIVEFFGKRIRERGEDEVLFDYLPRPEHVEFIAPDRDAGA